MEGEGNWGTDTTWLQNSGELELSRWLVLVKEVTRSEIRVDTLNIETWVAHNWSSTKGQRQYNDRVFFIEENWSMESESKNLQRCGKHKQLLSLDAGWEARRAGASGAWGPPPWNLWVGTLACIGKVSPALRGSRKAGFPVFSAFAEALPAALPLWYPGVMQNNQNVSRLITGNWGFFSKQRGLKDKYLLALSRLI